MVVSDRLTAQLEAGFVLFLIGMRVNKPWKIHKWLPVAMAMPRMLNELSQNTDLGELVNRGAHDEVVRELQSHVTKPLIDSSSSNKRGRVWQTAPQSIVSMHPAATVSEFKLDRHVVVPSLVEHAVLSDRDRSYFTEGLDAYDDLESLTATARQLTVSSLESAVH